METNCPICNKEYKAINKSFEVCDKHQNWIVTICEICKLVCFSDCIGVCPECMILDDLENADYFAKKPTF